MSRAILGLVGLGFFAWAGSAYVMHDFMSARMGLVLKDGDGMMEFLAINTGLMTAIGVFCILGAVLDRLRIPATLTLLVFGTGVLGGRVVGLVRGADPGAYTYTAFGIEASLIALAAIAFVLAKREASQALKTETASAPMEPKREREPTIPSTPSALK